MLLYDHIFHREMCSMTCQTGRPLPDWPECVTSLILCNFFFKQLFCLSKYATTLQHVRKANVPKKGNIVCNNETTLNEYINH